jgi:hypothetical protein
MEIVSQAAELAKVSLFDEPLLPEARHFTARGYHSGEMQRGRSNEQGVIRLRDDPEHLKRQLPLTRKTEYTLFII